MGLMTTLAGAAIACSRAARFGVSPLTASLSETPLADQIADHDVTGRNPHASLQPYPGARLEPGNIPDQLKPGAHRPLGIVLVRLGPAEVRQDALAQEPGYVPFEPADHVGASGPMRAHHLAQILRVEPRRQLGRADQIAEQHGQRAALGLDRPDRGERLRGSGIPAPVERGDGVEELAPMADRADAEAIRSSAVSRDSTSGSMSLAWNAST